MTTEDRATIAKLADLMEQGSKDTKQITGMYFAGDGVCGLGACLKAVGVTKKQALASHFSILNALGMSTWPLVPIDTEAKIYASRNGMASVADAIIYFNDHEGWDFSHIIAWLRSVAAEEIAS